MRQQGLSAVAGVWICFKLVLSATLLGGAAVFLWLGFQHGLPPWLFGVMGGLVFFAALPWVNLVRPSRALGLVVATFGLVLLALAIGQVYSPDGFPRDCAAHRRSVLCHFQNLLFDVGGVLLAALPFAATGTVLMAVGARLVLRHLRTSGDHRW